MDYLAITIGGETIQPPPGIPGCGIGCGEQIIQTLINVLFLGAFVFTLFMLVWGGIQWISSQGDAKAIDSARKRIIFAVIGLAVVLSAFLIIRIVGGVLGADNIIQATQ